jgi:hypothetical protein
MNGAGFVVPEDQRDFAESTSKKVQNWLENPDARAPLILESCNAFQRRIVYRHDFFKNLNENIHLKKQNGTKNYPTKSMHGAIKFFKV